MKQKTCTRMFFLGLVIGVLILAGCGLAEKLTAPSQSAPPVESKYAITDVTVIDVENGDAIPGQTVTIIGDRIDKIGLYGQLTVPQDALVIDGHGLFLMPGLVDAHVHYNDAAITGRLMIATGVTLVRDMGMPNEVILKLRDELNQGITLGPEMLTTGSMLDADPPEIPTIAIGVNTVKAGRAAVRSQAKAGVDMIKVYTSLDKEVFLAIINEAQKHNLQVVGHVPDSTYIEDAAEAGLDSAEHWWGFDKAIAKMLGESTNSVPPVIVPGPDSLQYLSEIDPQIRQNFYQRLKATGVVLDPTIVVLKDMLEVDTVEPRALPHGEFISQNLLAMWKSLWAGQTGFPDNGYRKWSQMVMEMNEAGIPIMVGTDLSVPGIIPGFSVHEEMQIWQEAGIPPADVLRSATYIPAEFMGFGDRLGSISQGKTASMVLVRGNPLEDIGNTEEIEAVFLRGRYFSRAELDQLLSEAKELAQQSNP